MRRIVALLAPLLAAAGCSGGPLKEMPVFEPPPPAPAAAAAVETLTGAWMSTRLSGPGSAFLQRIVMVFDEEGGFSAAAFGMSKISSEAGTYRSMDGAVEVDLGDGDVRLWPMELDAEGLRLRDGEREILLRRIR